MNNTMVSNPRLALFLELVEQMMKVKRETGVSDCLVLNSAVIDAANVFDLDLSLFELVLGDEIMVYNVVKADSGDDGGETNIILTTFSARQAYKLAVEKLDEILREEWAEYTGIAPITDDVPDQKFIDLYYDFLRPSWNNRNEHSPYGLENWWIEKSVVRAHQGEGMQRADDNLNQLILNMPNGASIYRPVNSAVFRVTFPAFVPNPKKKFRVYEGENLKDVLIQAHLELKAFAATGQPAAAQQPGIRRIPCK